MSVAFTKEDSAETASETLLPDRPISPHPNLVTEAILEKLANKSHIPNDRHRRQGPFLAQVALKSLDLLFEQAQSTSAYLLGWDRIMTTQKIEELLQRRSVTPVNPLLPSAISKVLIEMLRRDAWQTDRLICKPSAKTN